MTAECQLGAGRALHQNPGSKHQWLRNYFSRTLKLCQVDLVARTSGGCSWDDGGGGDGGGKDQRKIRVPKWSHWAKLFFYYFTLKMITVQYLQQAYNRIVHELNHLVSSSSSSSSSPPTHKPGNDTSHQDHDDATSSKLRTAHLEQLLARKIGLMETLGNPYYEVGFALEPVILNILTINLLVHTFAKFAISLHESLGGQPVHLSLLGLLQDSQAEHRLITQQVRSETDTVATSLLCRPSKLATTARCKFRYRSTESHRGRLAGELGRLARYGCVQPLNRHEEWLDQLFTRCAQFVVLNHLGSIPFIVLVLVVLPFSQLLDFKLHTSPRDLWFGAELLIYTVFGQQAICFYLSLLLFNSLDQIKHAHELDASIGQLVGEVQELNTAASACQGWPPVSQLGSISSNLNLKLALMLVHYRLFRGQLKSTQSLVGMAGGVTFCLMILMPLLGRAYIRYLDLKQRWLVVFCSIVYVFICDFIIIPNCYLHARCLAIVRHLSSLLAHLADSPDLDCEEISPHRRFSSTTTTTTTRNNNNNNNNNKLVEREEFNRRHHLYDEHLICLLRRELRDQQIVMTKFVTNAFFLQLTYADLIGVHFWCALVLGSILLTDLSRVHSTGNLFVDSLVSL